MMAMMVVGEAWDVNSASRTKKGATVRSHGSANVNASGKISNVFGEGARYLER